MTQNIHCPMIHSGLNIMLKGLDDTLRFNQCCLSTTPFTIPNDASMIWQNTSLQNIRKLNDENVWLDGCGQCERLENSGVKSFRQSMIEAFGVKKNLSGPQRIDFLFDRSCNLACRSCNEQSSTFWEKHLRDNSLPVMVKNNATDNFNKIKEILGTLDLSNLQQAQFCGGETLMGNAYWNVVQLLADQVPDAKNNLLLGFQTNGTQPIDEKYYSLIEKFKLVKLMISIDGINDRFDYLRWPANWNQVVDNIMHLRDTLPGNVMFFVQETTSCLNLLHFGEVGGWVKDNFNTNKCGDQTDHSTQLANHPYLNVNTITQEYVNALRNTQMFQFISPAWEENPVRIKEFICETEKFDKIRGQDWKKTFPEVAQFYSRYF